MIKKNLDDIKLVLMLIADEILPGIWGLEFTREHGG